LPLAEKARGWKRDSPFAIISIGLPRRSPKRSDGRRLVPASGIEPLKGVFSRVPVGGVSMPFIAHRVANKIQCCQCLLCFLGQLRERKTVQTLCNASGLCKTCANGMSGRELCKLCAKLLARRGVGAIHPAVQPVKRPSSAAQRTPAAILAHGGRI
jgi:hypothetical protein